MIAGRQGNFNPGNRVNGLAAFVDRPASEKSRIFDPDQIAPPPHVSA
jgi:hypothetical protein